MQYVIEKKLYRFGGQDDIVTENILDTIDDQEVDAAFRDARPGPEDGENFYKLTLWRQYDSMEGAEANTGCMYTLHDTDGRLALRRCDRSEERRG